MRLLTESSPHAAEQVERISLPGSVADRLYFAQVREDPRLEIEALQPTADDSLVVVGSGGCTSLSLLASGAGHVASVDLNRSQNHLIELKLAAVSALGRGPALGMLGALDWSAKHRWSVYADLRHRLSLPARTYWDNHRSDIEHGVLNAGVTERFIRGVMLAFAAFVQSRSRVERMLAATSVEEQRELFDREWNTSRWRGFFQLLLNRFVFRKAYDAAFFSHLERPSFAAHFRSRAVYTLTQLSVRNNYFLHHMLLGEYPTTELDGVPPYLSETGARAIAANRDALTLVDGSVTDYLRALPEHSVSGFALSNICEWLTPEQIDELFAQIVRTATPDARLVFRNFVGWTEVPERWRSVVVEDRSLGQHLIARDRALVQRRIAVCRVNR